jgi:hypothetical protein
VTTAGITSPEGEAPVAAKSVGQPAGLTRPPVASLVVSAVAGIVASICAWVLLHKYANIESFMAGTATAGPQVLLAFYAVAASAVTLAALAVLVLRGRGRRWAGNAEIASLIAALAFSAAAYAMSRSPFSAVGDAKGLVMFILIGDIPLASATVVSLVRSLRRGARLPAPAPTPSLRPEGV